jgi:chemotaxis protein MotA
MIMLALIGIIMVFAAVVGGFVMEQGNPWVLMPPAELVIVLGAGLGIVLVSNSRPLIWKKIRDTFAAFRPAAHNSHALSRKPADVVRDLRLLAARRGPRHHREQYREPAG